jgi:glycosyltransferase involved in cell wall biosynthesis
MKVAIVHELLTRRGGAERVARIFADMFPEAPIYTLLYNEQKLGEWFPRERVRPARLPMPCSLLPAPCRYNHHLHLSRFPATVEAWDFSDFDVVLSSSSAFVHGIITNSAPKHMCYVHSPARYLWDATHEVLEQVGKGPLGWAKRWWLERTFHKLRVWDAEVAPRADLLLANSKEVQRRIELYWRRESDVVYPPIEDFWLEKNVQTKKEDFYLIVSTLTPYKGIDRAIEACNKLEVPLKIAGEGRDRRRLEKLAGPTVELLGYQSNEAVRDLYTRAKAVLFPGKDDFGLVPVEAMACGAPVIALKEGGALETVQENETGFFFNAPTAESLEQTIHQTREMTVDPQKSRSHAQHFTRKRFEESIKQKMEKLL